LDVLLFASEDKNLQESLALDQEAENRRAEAKNKRRRK